MAEIDIKGMSAGYGGVDVLKGISLNIPEGRALSVLGPNGCGKTTLLRVVAGLLPYKGHVLIGGKQASGVKRKEMAKKIAVMTQSTGLYFSYTIYDTVMMGRHPHIKGGALSGASAEDREFVLECLKTVGLYEMRGKDITRLSGGQLQRVFLARALAQDPEIILLDEPTNHLDLKYQIELIDYLKEFSEMKGRTVVGVFHDINIAMRLSDFTVLMRGGKVTGVGNLKEIIREGILDDTYGMDIQTYMRDTLSKWQMD